ncbi:Beta-glucosidase 42 [Durusdinium trenchii]|uniref:Beta-glucosidase 42 n=1 Tax=Durusdinium trenchii TaxID=1381693 RepID=A0ABP0SF49_9DINO
MEYMFHSATSFDGSISSWDLSSLRSHGSMFGNTTLEPPCQAGRGPGRHYLMCERCGVGKFAPPGSFCHECHAGSVPSEDRGTCNECPLFQYSVSGVDNCLTCNLPSLVVDNRCVWWHLPLLALGFGGLAVASRFAWLWIRSRRTKKMERILEKFYEVLWEDEPNGLATYTEKLHRLGLGKQEMETKISAMRALQSQRAGVSIGYLLSAEFAQLAVQRTGQDDPTFIDMKTSFWLSEQPIGRNVICPRDGRAGCALVDWIPRHERREQTHFMSWTWKYTLQQVRSALERFQDNLAGPCYFFMCFFVNNQYRIIVEEMSSGSDNLENVFESNLQRIGSMVAILDTWDRPLYLSRIWTVYEQFVASTIHIEVKFIMPKCAAEHLQRQIACGSKGVDQVIQCLSHVDSERAQAWKLEDETKVKSLIQETVGFQHVNRHVTDVMITWIGGVVEQTCRELLDKARATNELKHELQVTAVAAIPARKFISL